MPIIINPIGITFRVSDVLARTDDMLNDEDRIRWPAPERVRYINDAMGAIITRKPGAFAQRVAHELEGGTAQALPVGGVLFLDLVRNLGSGSTPGVAIRRTDRQLLDDSDPAWHSGRQKAVIKHFTFDDRAPTVFYCYPPAIAGTRVELLYAALPEVLSEASTDGDIYLGREYMEAVVNYVAYRCKAKDSENGVTAEAAAYYAAFTAALGEKSVADVNASPNQPGNSV